MCYIWKQITLISLAGCGDGHIRTVSLGFVIFVGVVLPLVIVALWICWECCYEEDEEEDEENK